MGKDAAIVDGSKEASLSLHSKAKQNKPDGHAWLVQLIAVLHDVESSAKEVAQNSPIVSGANQLTDMIDRYLLLLLLFSSL